MTPAKFRLLLVFGVLAGIAGLLLDSLRSPFQEVDEQITTVELVILVVLAVVLLFIVVSTVGLFIFSWWAPPLALWSAVAALLGGPVLGPFETDGFAQSFYDLSSILFGATLAVAYWSPIAERFVRSR